jgi:plastocyanin
MTVFGRRSTRPTSVGRVPLFLASLVFVVATCAQTTSGGSASDAAAAASQSPGVPVVVKDFTLEPKEVSIPASGRSLGVSNQGPTVHNVTIRDQSGKPIAGTANLREGEHEDLAISLPAGTYVLYCSLPGHESLGIKGTLTVH